MSLDRGRIVEVLRRCPLFAGLEDEHLLALAGKSRAKTYDRDDHLFWTGDPGGTMYVIASGRVSIEKQDSDDRVKTISLRGPGEVIGELSLFVDGSRTADARAIESTGVVIVNSAQVDEFIDLSPRLARNVIELLATKLAQSTERYLEASKKLINRIAELLVTELRRTSQKDEQGRRILADCPSQQEIADRLNCSREHVNKALRQLKDDGIIETQGRRLVVIDAQALKSLAP